MINHPLPYSNNIIQSFHNTPPHCIVATNSTNKEGKVTIFHKSCHWICDGFPEITEVLRNISDLFLLAGKANDLKLLFFLVITSASPIK